MTRFPLSWITLFVITSYLMGIACLYRCLRIGIQSGWQTGFRELAVFFFFCGMGFFVESWAHARTPYYYYSSEFPDRLPRLQVEKLPIYKEPPEHECSTRVKE